MLLATAISQLSTTPTTKTGRERRNVIIAACILAFVFVAVAGVASYVQASAPATEAAKGPAPVSAKGPQKDTKATDSK